MWSKSEITHFLWANKSMCQLFSGGLFRHTGEQKAGPRPSIHDSFQLWFSHIVIFFPILPPLNPPLHTHTLPPPPLAGIPSSECEEQQLCCSAVPAVSTLGKPAPHKLGTLITRRKPTRARWPHVVRSGVYLQWWTIYNATTRNYREVVAEKMSLKSIL